MWNWMALRLFMAFNYLASGEGRQASYSTRIEKKAWCLFRIRCHKKFDPKFLILLWSNAFLRRAWLLLILLRSGFIALSGLSYYDYFSL
ncbi:hypothetical protein Peur_062254 [Populus x canadensis]